jgi:organic radical activating enzyme
MADFMRDPVRTLQYLVEEVKSKGYQIPFLTQGVSPGMDMSAIARMIDTKMQPFTQRSQQEQQQQQVAAQSKQELDTFLSDNEEANANLDVLAEMLQAQPSLTLHSAYTRMIRWAHENGLDWTQPLKQQIAAARAGQQPTHQQTTQQPTRAIPGRGGASGNGARPIQNNGNDVAQFNENASWADIIRSAMRESNVQLN